MRRPLLKPPTRGEPLPECIPRLSRAAAFPFGFLPPAWRKDDCLHLFLSSWNLLEKQLQTGHPRKERPVTRGGARRLLWGQVHSGQLLGLNSPALGPKCVSTLPVGPPDQVCEVGVHETLGSTRAVTRTVLLSAVSPAPSSSAQ